MTDPPAVVAATDQGHAATRNAVARLVLDTRAHRANCHDPGCVGFDVDQALGQRDAARLHGLLAVALVCLADGRCAS